MRDSNERSHITSRSKLIEVAAGTDVTEPAVYGAPFNVQVYGSDSEVLAQLTEADAIIVFGITEREDTDKPGSKNVSSFGAVMANGRQLRHLMFGLGYSIAKEIFTLANPLDDKSRDFLDGLAAAFTAGQGKAVLDIIDHEIGDEFAKLIAKRLMGK